MSSSSRPRKRDRWRDRLGLQRSSQLETSNTAQAGLASRPESPAQGQRQPVVVPIVDQENDSPVSQPNPTEANPPAPSPVLAPADRSFLQAALEKLTSKEKELVRGAPYGNASDINAAVTEAYEAALAQKQTCERRRWTWTVAGKEVVLRDQAEKVVRWLDKFKSIGDVAANADPIHIGLPWAGIRLLLEVTVSESRQMADLLSGMGVALYMSTRLEAYHQYRQRLPTAVSADKLEEHMVELFATVLKFLAIAIEIYRRSTKTRLLRALWDQPAIEAFNSQCDKLLERIDFAVDVCEKEMTAQDRQTTLEWRQQLKDTLRTLDEIQGLGVAIHGLHEKFDLSNLKTVPGAMYDSHEDEHMPRCLAGTRTDLLHQIAQWAQDPTGRCIFWLCGMAGTGKSTIARTVAKSLDVEHRLGASFFFKRGEGDRGIAKQFFPTIVLQLINLIPGLSQHVAQALEADTLLCERNLQQQFDKLVEQPFKLLRPQQNIPRNLVLVLDALDECERKDDIRMILKLLPCLNAFTSIHFRILVTSRPELPIEVGFRNMDGYLHQDVKLEEVQESTIEEDIRTFFQHRFEELRLERCRLPVDWPGEEAIQTLTAMTVPLFIFAATIFRFVSETTPQRRLEAVLKTRNNSASSQLAKTYLPVLEQLIAEVDQGLQDEVMVDFENIVGSIVLLAEPLSIPALASILSLDQEIVGDLLANLHSVLKVPSDIHEPVHLLHLSFRDFLVDTKRSDRDRFWINESETHSRLASKCLRLLSQPGVLRRDVCDVKRPGTRRDDVDWQAVAQKLPPDVAYACRYWVSHISQSKEELCENGQVHDFMTKHAVYWFEALAWLGQLPSAITLIDMLASRVQKGSDGLAALLDDAGRFLLSAWRTSNLAPLQLYYSALLFAPTRSIIRRLFEKDVCNPFRRVPRSRTSWGADVQRLVGGERCPEVLCFSHDSTTLASLHQAYSNKHVAIRLWNVRTGEERLSISPGKIGRGWPDLRRTKFRFSNDDRVLITAWNSGVHSLVEYWNTLTGDLEHTFGSAPEQATPRAKLIDTAPDGCLVAMTWFSRTVDVLDLRTMSQVRLLDEHFHIVTAIAFSHDSQHIATGTADGTVCSWNIKTGHRTCMPSECRSQIHKLTYLPSNPLILASASDDCTIRVWNLCTGEPIRTLDGHKSPVDSLFFISGGEFMVSGSIDQEIKVWEVSTRKQIYEFRGHSCFPRAQIAFSSDRSLLALTDAGGCIHLIDLLTMERVETLGWESVSLQEPSKMRCMTFSYTGLQIAASQYKHTRVWDLSTANKGTSYQIDCAAEELMFSADDTTLVGLAYDDHPRKFVQIWQARTGKLIRTISSRPNEEICAALVISDHQVMTLALSKEQVKLFEHPPGQDPEPKYSLLDDRTESTDLSADGELTLTGSSHGAVELWRTLTGERVRKFCRYGSCVEAAALSQVADSVISVFSNCTVQSWNLHDGEHLWTVDVSHWPIQDNHGLNSPQTPIIFSTDGRMLALWNGRTFELRCTRTGRLLDEVQQADVGIGDHYFRAHFPNLSSPANIIVESRAGSPEHMSFREMIEFVGWIGHSYAFPALSSNGKLVATLTIPPCGAVQLWDPARLYSYTGDKSSLSPKIAKSQVRQVSFSPDNRTVVATADHSTKLWDAAESIEDFEFDISPLKPLRATTSLDGSLIAVWDSSAFTQVLNVSTSKLVGTLRIKDTIIAQMLPGSAQDLAVSELVFLPTQQVLACAYTTSEIFVLIWDSHIRRTLMLESTGKHHGVAHSALAFTPDGNTLVLVAIEGTQGIKQPAKHCMLIWDLKSAKLSGRHTIIQDNVKAVTLTPDAQLVVTASASGVIVWERSNATQVQVLEWPVNCIPSDGSDWSCAVLDQTQVRFSTDGLTVYTSSFGTYTLEWSSSFRQLEALKRIASMEYISPWIRHRDDDLVCVPHGYGTHFDLALNTLVIDQSTLDTLAFFQLVNGH